MYYVSSAVAQYLHQILKCFFTVLSLPTWKDPLLSLFEAVWEKCIDINLKY